MENRRDHVEPPAFLADQMLARVARHLRLLGYDCELVSAGKSDEALVQSARAHGRILLTCVHSLGVLHPDDVVVFPTGDTIQAVRELTRRWPLDFARAMFTRCSVCNVPVESLDPSRAGGRVPEHVIGDHLRLTTCPTCNRVYWQGGHVERVREAFARLYGIAI